MNKTVTVNDIEVTFFYEEEPETNYYTAELIDAVWATDNPDFLSDMIDDPKAPWLKCRPCKGEPVQGEVLEYYKILNRVIEGDIQ